MPFNLKPTLANKIIDILSLASRIKVEELHKRINLSISCSLSGVYKELRYLLENGIIVRERNRYSLSLSWIFHVSNYAEKLVSKYLNIELVSKYIPIKQKKRVWNFKNLNSLDDFWNELLIALHYLNKNDALYEWSPTPWFAFVHNDKEQLLEESVVSLNKKIFIIFGEGNEFNRKIIKTKLNRKQNYKISFSDSYFHRFKNKHINVIGDYVLTVQLSRNTVQTLEEFFQKNHSFLLKKELELFLKTFSNTSNCKIMLENNSQKTIKLRRIFKDYFC